MVLIKEQIVNYILFLLIGVILGIKPSYDILIEKGVVNARR